ncbi:MAG: hypothetical protein A2W18_09370 [Candidatus Muproteobacteria bacterium RBG_16_60_9]|uniref:Uncharacterized protein n=1 Tax=Candidatus Muproteobacteria bacterium RBG_16_60_9 TaxID=1817755 RepID=A0A1F6V5C2_9PROT|nr:MAG: hypothetical protein A2W18_09370 [Candidatus Muproteobacteria bacterium RBG_16_60_9]
MCAQEPALLEQVFFGIRGLAHTTLEIKRSVLLKRKVTFYFNHTDPLLVRIGIAQTRGSAVFGLPSASEGVLELGWPKSALVSSLDFGSSKPLVAKDQCR